MDESAAAVRVRARDLGELEPLPPGVARPLRVLLLADTSHPARVVQDYIRAIADLSVHEVELFNPCGWTDGELPDTSHIDVMIIHYSLYILGRHYLPAPVGELVYDFDGPKVQIIQDEYRDIAEMTAKMRRLGVSVIISSLSVENIRRVYGELDVDAYSNLPGALTPDLLDRPVERIADREIDVAYRAYSLPYTLGAHAQLKPWLVTIGRRLGSEHGLRVDVSDRNDDRIYGEAWPDFIASSRTTLGCEGGASVFDFGGVADAVAAYEADHPDASFEEVHDSVLHRVDGSLVHRTITPRVFETIALRTAMVLVEGEYRGFLRPWEHYVPLERGGANLDEVAEAIRDPELLQGITSRAYEEIGCSDEVSWPYMIERLDAVILEANERCRAVGSSVAPAMPRRPRALVLCDVMPGRPPAPNPHAAALRDYSTIHVDLMPFDAPGADLDLDAYDVIHLVWPSVWRLDGRVSPDLRRRIRLSPALKVAYVRDDYHWVEHAGAAMRRLDVGMLFTEVPAEDLDDVYASLRSEGIEVHHLASCELDPSLRHRATPRYSERPVDVVYRALDLPSWLSLLAPERRAIGLDFLRASWSVGLVTDVAATDGAQLVAAEQTRLLTSSKAVLGSDRSPSVIDFSTRLDDLVRGAVNVPADVELPDGKADHLRRLDGAVVIRQASPGLVEAAALRTLLILVDSGSEVLRPWVHYVPLQSDFGNLAEVAAVLRDEQAATGIIQNAYDDIACHPARRHQASVRRIDDLVRRRLGRGR